MVNSADLIRRWFDEVWNQGREEAIDELCSKDALGHGQTHDGADIVGPENFKLFLACLPRRLHIDSCDIPPDHCGRRTRHAAVDDHDETHRPLHGHPADGKADHGERHEHPAICWRENRRGLGQL